MHRSSKAGGDLDMVIRLGTTVACLLPLELPFLPHAVIMSGLRAHRVMRALRTLQLVGSHIPFSLYRQFSLVKSDNGIPPFLSPRLHVSDN